MNSPVRIRLTLPRDAFRLHVDLALEGQGITGLFGESGSGKTSLLRCLAGLEKVADGHIEVGGETWLDTEAGVNRPPHERSLAYVFQEPRLFPHLSVERNLQYAAKRAESSAVSYDHVVELLSLTRLLPRNATQLSGGEAKRVAIARALLRSPSLLLMDEPLSSLDAGKQRELLPYLDRLQADLTIPVIYVSHSIDEITQLSDQLVVLASGAVQAAGPLQEVLLRTDIELLGGAEAGVILETDRKDFDNQHRLTRLQFSGGDLWVSADVPSPHPRVRIRANDVSLCKTRPADSSILNIVPVVVEEITADGEASVLVELHAGSDQLLARITRRSLRDLDIAVGSQLFAQIKSVAVRNSAVSI
ncbi:MAG: molybdenum ABC transporter ATP-binding protein [Woeseiaceae bacterium]|nr:molybdenum ABC transporter ATP-binding protein [Woeseiaceae bacterium]